MAAAPEPALADVPRAVAIVMDGNGRWASAHGSNLYTTPSPRDNT
jgi:undecaprenyl pyrophosphate synthase